MTVTFDETATPSAAWPVQVGGVAGAFLALGILDAFGVRWMVLPSAVIVAGAYALASAARGRRAADALRGGLLGYNAALNLFLASAIVGRLFGSSAGWAVGLLLGLLNALALVGPIAADRRYQAVLGWFCWLLPMSWLVVAPGAILFVLSLLGHLFLGWPRGHAFWKVSRLTVDRPTGSLFVCSGWVSNLNAFRTAFNMGSFSYVHRASPSLYVEHEAGHALNLAAFGSVVHLLGAAEENLLHRGADAYAERLAEGHVAGTVQTNVIPMWSV
jgi:hypothetical protein